MTEMSLFAKLSLKSLILSVAVVGLASTESFAQRKSDDEPRSQRSSRSSSSGGTTYSAPSSGGGGGGGAGAALNLFGAILGAAQASSGSSSSSRNDDYAKYICRYDEGGQSRCIQSARRTYEVGDRCRCSGRVGTVVRVMN